MPYNSFVLWTVSSATFVDHLTNDVHMWPLDTILLDAVIAANLFFIDTSTLKIHIAMYMSVTHYGL